jgi:hypothetical protein
MVEYFITGLGAIERSTAAFGASVGSPKTARAESSPNPALWDLASAPILPIQDNGSLTHFVDKNDKLE